MIELEKTISRLMVFKLS